MANLSNNNNNTASIGRQHKRVKGEVANSHRTSIEISENSNQNDIVPKKRKKKKGGKRKKATGFKNARRSPVRQSRSRE